MDEKAAFNIFGDTKILLLIILLVAKYHGVRHYRTMKWMRMMRTIIVRHIIFQSLQILMCLQGAEVDEDALNKEGEEKHTTNY